LTPKNKNASQIIDLQGIKILSCDPDWIQTNDPKLRRFVLYSAELPGRYKNVRKLFASDYLRAAKKGNLSSQRLPNYQILLRRVLASFCQ
jgi:hypothetical protein